MSRGDRLAARGSLVRPRRRWAITGPLRKAPTTPGDNRPTSGARASGARSLTFVHVGHDGGAQNCDRQRSVVRHLRRISAPASSPARRLLQPASPPPTPSGLHRAPLIPCSTWPLGADDTRYIWTINGKAFEERTPLDAREGQRVRLRRPWWQGAARCPRITLRSCLIACPPFG